MWDGFNKRKFPRLSIHCEITVLPDGKNPPIIAQTENLGRGGVCVLLDRELERFSECLLKLDLGSKYPKVECGGKVVWIIPTLNPEGKGRYDIGIEFKDLDQASSDAIAKVMDQEAHRVANLKP